MAGRWFGVAESQVHLVDAPHDSSGIDPTGPHFCLGVDDIAAAAAELKAHEIPWVESDAQGVRQIWFCDPAGNTIELQEDR